MHSLIGSRRIVAFAVAYLLISAAGTVGAYLTQGAASAWGTMVFTVLFFLPMFGWVQELESRRVERERSQGASHPDVSPNK